MKKAVVLALVVAIMALLLLGVGGSALAGGKECSPGDPGCKTCSEDLQGSFDKTETQRGNCHANGTTSTEITSCTNDNDHELKPGSHQNQGC